MKILVRVRGLMTAAAFQDRVQQMAGRRVRIVAAGARVRAADLRMIGVHVGVAALAGPFRALSNRVRRMAIRALVVGDDHGFAQHVHRGVARAARRGRGFRELVRLVAGDALRVPVREERALRHDRPRVFMALCARVQGFGSAPVLALMAGRTHLNRRFAERCVAGRDLLVAAGACSGFRARVVVRAMAAHALARRVHDDRRQIALLLAVTAHAVARTEISMRNAGIGSASGIGSVRRARVEGRLRPVRRAAVDRTVCDASIRGRGR